jgi:hypothetical protein
MTDQPAPFSDAADVFDGIAKLCRQQAQCAEALQNCLRDFVDVHHILDVQLPCSTNLMQCNPEARTTSETQRFRLRINAFVQGVLDDELKHQGNNVDSGCRYVARP